MTKSVGIRMVQKLKRLFVLKDRKLKTFVEHIYCYSKYGVIS